MKNTYKLIIILIASILLTSISVASISSLTLNSPINNYNTTDNTPDFNFTVTGNETNYSCELFLNDTGYGTLTDTWTYQEDANSFSDPSDNISDGDWGTGSTNTIYANYTKPINSRNISLWQVKSHKSPPTYNKSIPNLCWIQNVLQFKMYQGSIIRTAYFDCYNGSEWVNIYTQLIFAPDYPAEEAMWWYTTAYNNTPSIITANTTVTDGLYNWYINCTSNSVTNQSATRNITIDTTPPNVTINKPISESNHTTTNITLNVSASDVHQSVDTCWYSIDSWATNITFTPNTETWFTGDHGSNTLQIGCNDSLGNLNDTESNTFYVFTPPAFVSPTPAVGWNSSNNNSFDVKIQLNVSHDICYFEWNSSSNVTMGKTNVTEFYYNKTETVAGNYTYKVWCNSTVNGYWGESEIRWLTIYNPPADTSPPEIYNFNPPDTGTTTYGYLTTSVLVTCNSNEDANVSYHLNTDYAYANMTAFTTTNGTSHSTTVSGLVVGANIIYIRGQDASGNNNTVSYTIDITRETEAGGGGGGGGEEHVVNFRLFPSFINPSQWTSTLQNTSWSRLVTFESQEDYIIRATPLIDCNYSHVICAEDLCSLNIFVNGLGDPQPIPFEGFLVNPRGTSSVQVSCRTPTDAKLGDIYKAGLVVTACKADSIGVCETRTFPIEYRVDAGGFYSIYAGVEEFDFSLEEHGLVLLGVLLFFAVFGFLLSLELQNKSHKNSRYR